MSALGRLAAAAALLAAGPSACGDGGRSGEPAGGLVEPSPGPAFVEVAEAVGLAFMHVNGGTGAHHMAEITGAGGALFDYDGDGDLDAYLVQGGRLGEPAGGPPVPGSHVDRLFRNDLVERREGRLEPRFRDVTEASGLAAGGYGMGIAVGDVDNDGWTDLYLTNYGPNQLWRNRGDGTFEDITRTAGVDDPRWSLPAVFFDYDGDGWLDLFVGNYLRFPRDPPVCRDVAGSPDYCGPDSFPAEADRLWRNRGDGTFEDVGSRLGLTAGFGPAMGCVAVDFDGDRRLELYVANDNRPNNLWRNRGGRGWSDDALLAGCSVNGRGQAEASMGVAVGDYDGDGDLDLFLTHLTAQTNTLYANDGSGMFHDATLAAGVGPGSRPYTSFGVAWLDADNDGWLDLLVANGAIKRIPERARRGDPTPFDQPNQLFRNAGDGRFAEITAEAGAVLEAAETSRGLALGDVDNDGDQDALINNNGGPARLLLSRLDGSRRWLGLRLLLGERRREASGARAAALLPDRRALWRRLAPDGSYASASDPRGHFGLADDASPVDLLVEWPDGRRQRWVGLRTGVYATLVSRAGSW